MPNILLIVAYDFSYKMKKSVPVVKREPNDDLLEEIKAGRVNEVNELPPSKNVDISRLPSPLPFQKNRNTIVDLDNVG